MRQIILLLFLIFLLQPDIIYSQGIKNIWLTGYESQYGDPNFGESTINFLSGSATVSSNSLDMDFRQTHANIADTIGNILFYTNGYYIADANGDTMLNGSGINPSTFTTNNPRGLTIPQGAIIIPFPGHASEYLLFHSTIDDSLGVVVPNYLYYSIVDITLNFGLGEVIQKNQVAIFDELDIGKISGIKHANGRDWWITCFQANSDSIYTLLVTPNGIGQANIQQIGDHRIRNTGQVSVSNDGSRLAYYFFLEGLEIFEFDRCTGLFTNPILISTPFTSGYGVSFSPSGNKVYVSDEDSLFQYDLTSSNVAGSQTLVAVYDSFLSSGPIPLPTMFNLLALAPDGKIYMTTGNGTQHYHIIDQPDSLGLACNVIQHGLQLPHYYFNTLPNHPNYHLGPLVGSVCDTIYNGLPPPEERLTLKLYPNPNNGTFQITYTPVPESLQLKVFNILGNEVHTQLLPQWSQLQNIKLSNINSGIYFAKLSSTKSSTSIKFMIE